MTIGATNSSTGSGANTASIGAGSWAGAWGGSGCEVTCCSDSEGAEFTDSGSGTLGTAGSVVDGSSVAGGVVGSSTGGAVVSSAGGEDDSSAGGEVVSSVGGAGGLSTKSW